VSAFTPRDGGTSRGAGLYAITVRDNKETAMRRIALIAGVTATLAGGAAALAAAPDPAAPTTAPPDPYLGSWALTMDGAPAGPYARVDGCSLQAKIVLDQSGGQNPTGKHVAGVAPEPCTIEFGGGMSSEFRTLLSDAVGGNVTPHKLQIVRTDPQGGYAFDLTGATIASVTVPKLDRASTTPVYIKATLKAEQIRRVAASGRTKGLTASLPLDPRTLAFAVGGQPLRVNSVGPWTVNLASPDSVGELRDYRNLPTEVELGDLPIRMPEADRKAFDAVLDPWVDATLTKGVADERPVTVSAADFTLTLDHAGIARADLAARADGARSYDLYSERAAIDAG
jgi:hypothetical protein